MGHYQRGRVDKSRNSTILINKLKTINSFEKVRLFFGTKTKLGMGDTGIFGIDADTDSCQIFKSILTPDVKVCM